MFAWKHHGLELMAVSMVGGAENLPTQWVMQREFPRALVLNLSGKTRGAHAPLRILLS